MAHMIQPADLLVIPLSPEVTLDALPGVRTRTLEAAPVTGRDLHRHDMGQLYCLTAGLCVIEDAAERLSLPPGQIGWIPPETPHAALRHGDIVGWAAYIAPGWCGMLPSVPCTLECSPLIPLIMERFLLQNGCVAMAAASEALDPPATADDSPEARTRRLFRVLLDELEDARPVSKPLPLPRDPRFLPVLRSLLHNPADPRHLAAWARQAMLSERSFSRLFARETGMPFNHWRRRVRLMRGRELLAAGASVQEAAWGVGYENVSAFIAGFRQLFGTTPGQAAGRQRKRSG
ncbi:helix-turn-helix transcriptional regulator [Desulfovibrio sulfodismutans]|uniref:Helix-turn-helix transcriptional regulator n=1 Tax=Desulfolutivibrio sulfodismutans TaxID=63561 RepID=A0A7K3NQM1_9BACT|nr:helix-turn-helix transcriptional regulator [Desulfolutivibrio sulfodismutans]NDY58510.1 helix-turn-helix transcriptional regulator [Desulfolutivibrio sulfodismutans]QLA12575.1 helix-turn-helix domain-containing protein [Desulfolutivibrio sulfodismutans DSM 3696]